RPARPVVGGGRAVRPGLSPARAGGHALGVDPRPLGPGTLDPWRPLRLGVDIGRRTGSIASEVGGDVDPALVGRNLSSAQRAARALSSAQWAARALSSARSAA